MIEAILEILGKPFFKQILKEWSLHVKTDQNPTIFANMYLEWMRDPLDYEGRKDTTMFVNFMQVRDWSQMMETIEPALDPDVVEIFRSETAADFYEEFRAMVIEQIRDYWEQFIMAQKEKVEELGPREWSPRTGKCSCKKNGENHALPPS